jgi:hypothetical protein
LFRRRGSPDSWFDGDLAPEISRLQFRAPFRTSLAELKVIGDHGGNLRVLQPIVSEGPGYRLALPPYAAVFARFS